nr:increased DNA methylation 1-like [Coffea arabica]
MMEEYFDPMVDPRSIVNMIPQLIYNWGSKFPCEDCSRFYTVVLEKGDTLIALASIRCINEKKPPCVMLFVYYQKSIV